MLFIREEKFMLTVTKKYDLPGDRARFELDAELAAMVLDYCATIGTVWSSGPGRARMTKTGSVRRSGVGRRMDVRPHLPIPGDLHSICRRVIGARGALHCGPCGVLWTAAVRSAAMRREGRYGVTGAREAATGRYGPVVRSARV